MLALKPRSPVHSLSDAVGQAQQAAGFLGVRQHLLQLVRRFFRLAVDIHFHLVELVAALDAAHIPPGAHLFAAEAGGIGGITQRQVGLRQDFTHVQPGQRHLGGGHHPEVFFGIVIQVFGKLGQLPGGKERLGLHHEGRVFFQVTLADVQVEHPGDQGALQAGAVAAQDVKARA